MENTIFLGQHIQYLSDYKMLTLLDFKKWVLQTFNHIDNMTRRHPGHDQTKMLSQMTKFKYHVFGANRKFQGGDYGNAILSNHPFINIKAVVFTKPGENQPRCSTPQPNDYCQGIVATLITKDNFSFWYATTHFGMGPNESTQLEQARQSLVFIKSLMSISPNIVFGGDLNVQPNSRTIAHLLADLKFKDLWTECKGVGPGYTFNARTPDRRIDFMFVNFKVSQCRVLVDPSQNSDHRPFYASFDV